MTSSEMGCGSSWDLVTPLSEVASMKLVPSHPSLTSMSTEPARRIIDSTDGKTLMTLALRHPSQACGRGEEVRCIPESVSPHSFRHQGAIDLLESGVSLVYIRDLLGHRSVTTTEIYATADTARKRELPGKAATAPRVGEYPDWTADKDLMAWPKALC